MKPKKASAKKVVLLVEDKLVPLKNVLLSIQAILFVANKRNAPNAPQSNKTEIIVYHLVPKDQKGDRDLFERYKRTLEKVQDDQENVLKIKYSYEVYDWDTSNYPQNAAAVADSIVKAIQKLCTDKEYSVILDAILCEDVDANLLINSGSGEKILSQIIFEQLSDHCIPYTNYGQGTIGMRKKWKEGIKSGENVELFQRQYLVSDAIYKPFRKLLFSQLKIGDDLV